MQKWKGPPRTEREPTYLRMVRMRDVVSIMDPITDRPLTETAPTTTELPPALADGKVRTFLMSLTFILGLMLLIFSLVDEPLLGTDTQADKIGGLLIAIPLSILYGVHVWDFIGGKIRP